MTFSHILDNDAAEINIKMMIITRYHFTFINLKSKKKAFVWKKRLFFLITVRKY